MILEKQQMADQNCGTVWSKTYETGCLQPTLARIRVQVQGNGCQLRIRPVTSLTLMSDQELLNSAVHVLSSWGPKCHLLAMVTVTNLHLVCPKFSFWAHKFALLAPENCTAQNHLSARDCQLGHETHQKSFQILNLSVVLPTKNLQSVETLNHPTPKSEVVQNYTKHLIKWKIFLLH